VTLFETILVVAVILIAAAIAVPSLSSMYGDTPMTAAADKVKSRWAEAKARAAAENRPYRFALIPGTSKFRVAPDSPEFWDGANAPADGRSLVLDDKLPNDIYFATPDDAGGFRAPSEGGGEWSSPIVFLPDGTAREDAVIAFAEPGSRPLLLRLQGSTGAVSTSR
jgi:hypothetical protein